jgi:inner membrane protein
MDSITHIVVGATTAYLIGGKKYGKRAMIWGAIGGSLPDIDVVSGLWLDPDTSLMAHRGITHSILFLLCISPILA